MNLNSEILPNARNISIAKSHNINVDDLLQIFGINVDINIS